MNTTVYHPRFGECEVHNEFQTKYGQTALIVFCKKSKQKIMRLKSEFTERSSDCDQPTEGSK